MNHQETMKDVFMKTQWWGKVLGGICGYLIVGPIGSLFGILIGNIFDKALASFLINPHLPFFKKTDLATRELFYTKLFATLGHLAKCNGHVSKEEIHYARYVIKQLRLSKKEKIKAKYAFNEGKKASFSLDLALSQIHYACIDKPPLLQLFVETCLQMGVISKVTLNKKVSLNLIFKRLGYKPYFKEQDENFNQRSTNYHYQQTTDEIFREEKPNDYQILGIKPGCSPVLIKKAYRQKISQYHPDRLIARRASTKEIKEATEKSQEIQAAYDRLKNLHKSAVI